jgi:hypothetical protein
MAYCRYYPVSESVFKPTTCRIGHKNTNYLTDTQSLVIGTALSYTKNNKTGGIMSKESPNRVLVGESWEKQTT